MSHAALNDQESAELSPTPSYPQDNGDQTGRRGGEIRRLHGFSEFEFALLERIIRVEEAQRANERILQSLIREMTARFDGVNNRFDDVNKRFDDVNKRFDDINKRFEEMNTNFKLLSQRLDRYTIWVTGMVVSLALFLTKFG